MEAKSLSPLFSENCDPQLREKIELAYHNLKASNFNDFCYKMGYCTSAVTKWMKGQTVISSRAWKDLCSVADRA